jgi:O-antigen/teichoic acid export membrane protein
MSEASHASAESGAEPRRDEHVQVAKGAGLTGIGAVIEGLLRYLSMLLVTSQYGRAAYGVFGFVMTVNELGQRASSAGLHDGVMRHVAVHQSRGEIEQTRGAILFAGKIILGIGFAYAFGLWFLADTVADQLPEEKAGDVPREMVIDLVRISCFALPTTALLMLFGRTLRALKLIGKQVIVRSFVQPLSRVLLIVAFLALWGPADLDGLAWAIVLSATLAAGLGLWYVHRQVGLIGRVESSIDKREFMRYALPLVGVDIVVFFSLSADIFLLTYLRKDNLAPGVDLQGDLGTYMAVRRLLPILGMPLYLFSSLLTPLSAQLYGQGRTDDLRQLYRTSVRWIFAISLPFAITGFLWATPILGHLGEGFDAGASAFMLLAGTLIINGFANPAGYAVTMAGHSRLTLLNAIASLIAIVLIGYWLIPEHGVFGAAAAFAGSLFVNCVLTLYQGWKILGLNPLHGALVKPLIAGTLGGLAAWGMLSLGWLPASILGALLGGMLISAIYALVLGVLGLDQQDKDVLLAGSKPFHGLARKIGGRLGR